MSQQEVDSGPACDSRRVVLPLNDCLLFCCLSHAHKNTVMEVKWNLNGNWLLTASRDHLCKLFDIRNLKEELQVFRGHKKEATGVVGIRTLVHLPISSCVGITLTLFVCVCVSPAVAWHPVHEGLFASGGSDGSLLFWHTG